MTRLLLIADELFAQPLCAALSSAADFQIQQRARFAVAKKAVAAGAFDACVLVPAALSGLPDDVAAARAIAPQMPVIAVVPEGASTAVQQNLLLAGADLVLAQPIDAAALASALQRLTARGAFSPGPPPAEPAAPAASGPPLLGRKAAALSSALEVLRDFSQVLGFSLDHRQLTQHFVLKLREVVGLARIAIFLEPAPADGLPVTGALPADDHSMPCAAAVGLATELVECFALSRKSGLGRLLTRQPQILRAPSLAAPGTLDPKVLREFEVLGGSVAIPVNDRERTLGVAVLGGRITGGEFSDEELLLVYHLLEELGLAVKNGWLHTQLVGSHQLFSSVLDGITSGALVLGPGANVLYANRAIGGLLRHETGAERGSARVEFADLPAPIAAKLRAAAEQGTTCEPFAHEMPETRQLWRVSIMPLRQTPDAKPQAAMLLLEDFTQVRAAQRAEIESSNLKLIGVIARRFAHEIRNSLVPLTTHHQLFDAEIEHPEFRASLKEALARETQRIERFTEQMLLLARSDSPPSELAPLEDMLRQGFAKSRELTGGQGELEIHSDLPPVLLRCNRPGLTHAFQEIFLNGLQSATGTPHLVVTLTATPTEDGKAELVVSVRDSGRGFATEAAHRATEPFFTTRNTGVGLGLTIARRVIEAHRGRLEVHSRNLPTDADLTIYLPFPR
ncbi:MAG: PAS domain-containing protein [Opitutae bacterium]|nr:PAS domain-containing protein [Opitutae bacterium]